MTSALLLWALPLLVLILFYILCFSSIAGSSEDKDLRVVDETVGNRCGHSGRVEHLSPFSEG